MSLKEVLSVFGPGFKNPTLSDIEQLSESLLEYRHALFSANTRIEVQPVLCGSRRFVILAGTGSQRECMGSDIRGCQTLPQVILQPPASHSRASSKFRLFTKDDCRVLAIITTVDLDGRSSTIKWIKPDEETDDYFSISRQQTTVIVTALMLSTSKLMERLEHARKILANDVPSNLSNIPRQIRYDRASRRASSLRWSFKPSCILVVCAIPLVLVFWHSAPTEFVNDENRTSYATESSEVEEQRRKILTLRTYDFSRDVSYSTRWPPTTTDIEKLTEKTVEFLTYALSMRALGVKFDSRGSCSSRHWLSGDLRAEYFDVYDVITVHAAWIMENGDVPEIYRFFVSKTYAVMDLMDYMDSRTLCYVGDDLARDSFEFYVRLLYHFEYATHVIVLRQWGVQQAFDAVDVLMCQASSFRSWLEDRWIPSEDSSCLRYALLQTPVNPRNMLSQLPLQDYLFDPYAEDIRKYVMTSPPWR